MNYYKVHILREENWCIYQENQKDGGLTKVIASYKDNRWLDSWNKSALEIWLTIGGSYKILNGKTLEDLKIELL